MKKHIGFLVCILCFVAITNGKTILIHRANDIDAFFASEIDSIRYSNVGLDGNSIGDYDIQEIWTADSIYRYDVSEIDSITFHNREAIAKSNAIDLSGDIQDYVKGESLDEYNQYNEIILSGSIPESLIPQEGDFVYQLDPSAKLPAGFAGQIKEVYKSGNDILLCCYDAEPEDIFDHLIWDSDYAFDVDDENQNIQRPVLSQNQSKTKYTGSVFTSDFSYPELISGVIQMTDELKDIPAGPEKAEIRGVSKLRPKAICQYGFYVLGKNDGRMTNMRRFKTSVVSTINIHIEGRQNAEEKHIISTPAPVKVSIPLGLGRNYTMSYSANMSVKGKMGIDHDFENSYNSVATVFVKYNNEGDVNTRFSHRQMMLHDPAAKLDASMDGEISLSNTLTFSMVHGKDSLKSISNIFTYGSKLKGKALYLSSEIASAATDTKLYDRITETGVTVMPVKSVTSSVNYESMSLKKTSVLSTSPDVYYAVPKLASPNWNADNKKMSYTQTGTSMSFASSTMGVAVKKPESDDFSWYSSENVWPTNCDKYFEVSIPVGITSKDIIYPTVTLPSGDRILASPEYPRKTYLFPYITYMEKDGVRVISGSPILDYSKGSSIINVGNILPFNSNE